MILETRNPISNLFNEIGYESFVEDEEYQIDEIYKNEHTEIRTRNGLVNHINRWRILFQLSVLSHPLLPEKHLLKRFDSKTLFDKFTRIRNGFDNKDFQGDGRYYDLAASIFIPSILLISTMQSRKFKISPNIVLLQKYGWTNVYK